MNNDGDNATCNEKHTKYDPTQAEFACPKCGAECGDFVVDESPNLDCEALHDEDMLRCFKCKYDTTGKTFARRLMKAKNLVKCECCKGTGLVLASGK